MKYILVQGRANASLPTIKWGTISNVAAQFTGTENPQGVFAFPTETKRQEFAEWYEKNSPAGITVRTRVAVERIKQQERPLSQEALQQLKELRMWHWRQVIRYRQLQKIALNALHEGEAAAFKVRADRHVLACQALNNILPGTGEQDCAEVDRDKA